MKNSVINRVYHLRQLMGLSRSDMCRRYGIPRGTIQNWEAERYPLSEKGAQRLCMVADAEGIQVSEEWLRFGHGKAPELSQLHRDTYTELTESMPFIKNELQYFKTHNENTIEMIVHDSHMEPIFQLGDVVAGIRYYHDDIIKADACCCIVHTNEHGLLLRQVRATEVPDRYHLLSLNHQTAEKTELHYCRIISAAPILWHRRPDI